MKRALEWIGTLSTVGYVIVALTSNVRDVAEVAGVVAAALLIHIALHELAHAIAGTVAGLRVTRIVTGSGPCLFAGSFFGTKVELRLFPFSGLTGFALRHPGQSNQWVRLRMFFATAAGPLATLGVALAGPGVAPSAWAVSTESAFGPATVALGNMLFGLGMTLFVINLWPMPGNDGSALWWLVRAPDDELERWAKRVEAGKAFDMVAGGDHAAFLAEFPDGDSIDNPYVRHARAAALMLDGRFDEAVPELLVVLQDPTSESLRRLVHTNLAIALLEADDEHRWPEAAKWVDGLSDLWGPAHRLTLFPTGLQALRAGRVDDALEAAAGVITDARAANQPQHEAWGHQLRARAHRINGDHFAARTAIDRAHRLSPEDQAIGRDRSTIDEDSLRLAQRAGRSPELQHALRAPAGRAILEGARRAELAALEPSAG